MKKIKGRNIEIIIGLVIGFVLMAIFDFLEHKYPETIFGEHRIALFGFSVVILIVFLALYEKRKPKE